MVKNPMRIWPLKAAHMRRKPETRERCVSAPTKSLAIGTYLPPISRTITLPVKRRSKELIAYAPPFMYLYRYMRGEHRIRDDSPLPISFFFCQYSDPPLSVGVPEAARKKRAHTIKGIAPLFQIGRVNIHLPLVP